MDSVKINQRQGQKGGLPPQWPWEVKLMEIKSKKEEDGKKRKKLRRL